MDLISNNTTTATISSIVLTSTDLSYPVGITYITIGVVFITLQLVCAYLIYTDKDMKNPTYEFMISLSLIDCVALSSIGLYAGSILVTGAVRAPYEWLDAVVRLVQIVVWYDSCFVLAVVAFSRWVSITRPHKLGHIFSRRNKLVLHLAPIIVVLVFYSYPQIVLGAFRFYPTILTWSFNFTTTYGATLHWLNFVLNTICACVETTFNILSFVTVHQMRKSISENVITRKNQRREIKLLVQSFIIGCVFLAGDIIFTIALAGWRTLPKLVFMQLTWTSNHCVNPVVYLTMNQKLRDRFLHLITCGRWKVSEKTKVHTIDLSSPNTVMRRK